LPSISKKVRWRAVEPTSSMSPERKHFCTVVTRRAGGSSAPVKYRFSGCMPAVVSRTEVSHAGGTSDPPGTRRCPRLVK
jgi:hypothetical protein